MKDELIKRSDAIAAIKKAYHREYDGYGHQLNANIVALEKVPAAEIATSKTTNIDEKGSMIPVISIEDVPKIAKAMEKKAKEDE